jgi:hypothetical protein
VLIKRHFYAVSHSQGSQKMVFMAGNASTGSPYYNVTFNSAGSAVFAPYQNAFSGVLGIFTMGAAISGTQGSDRVCNGNWLDSLINFAFLGTTVTPVLNGYKPTTHI